MLLIFLMLISNISYAEVGGISFAMTSSEYYKDYKLPVFRNKQEAIIYGYKNMWSEPIRRLLNKKILELWEKADLTKKDKSSPTQEEINKAKYYMLQAQDYIESLKIITKNKKLNRKEYENKNKNGALFYAISEPL